MKSNALRKAAKGQECTFHIAGICSCDNETTVLCHVQVDGGIMGGKPSDLGSTAFGCSNCHDAIDGRVYSYEYDDHRWFYNCRAIVRTLNKLFDMGVITVSGIK